MRGSAMKEARLIKNCRGRHACHIAFKNTRNICDWQILGMDSKNEWLLEFFCDPLAGRTCCWRPCSLARRWRGSASRKLSITQEEASRIHGRGASVSGMNNNNNGDSGKRKKTKASPSPENSPLCASRKYALGVFFTLKQWVVVSRIDKLADRLQ